MTEAIAYITRHDVETALARIGKKLPAKYDDAYFADLCLRGGKGDGSEGDRCSIQERRAWEKLQADTDAIPTTDCPVVGTFIIGFQDRITDKAVRTRLMSPLLIKLIGSKSKPAVESRRRWVSIDWAIREGAVAWLERSPELAEHAAALKALPPIRCEEDFAKARKICYAARDAGYALRQTKIDELRDKLVPLIKVELEKRGIGPDSPAGADAVAVAVAGADAVAVAGAVAVADADAVADAVAVAVAVARGSDRWWEIRQAVYWKLRGHDDWKAWREKFLASVADTRLAVWESGAKCVERMLAVTEETMAAEHPGVSP